MDFECPCIFIFYVFWITYDEEKQKIFQWCGVSVYLVIGVARSKREAERERESESEWEREVEREREIMKLKQND